MGKTCAICGEPLDGGVVVHPECVPRWISVKDRLPEKYERVLVTFCYGEMTVAWISTNSKWESFDHYFDGDFVTHWMPLPEPPRKDNSNA